MGGPQITLLLVIFILLGSVWRHKDWKVRMLQGEHVVKGGMGEGS